MADLMQAEEFVIREEDCTLSGTVTDTPGDAGGKTRFGIASRFHPELVSSGFYSTMSRAEALQIAEQTMVAQYAKPLCIAQIADARLAWSLLSFGVNAGTETAARVMQHAVNAVCGLSPVLTVDGTIGPKTIEAMNRCGVGWLLSSFRLKMVAYYVSICRANATQLEFLCGWLDRALG